MSSSAALLPQLLLFVFFVSDVDLMVVAAVFRHRLNALWGGEEERTVFDRLPFHISGKSISFSLVCNENNF